jgi:hypothetical protein
MIVRFYPKSETAKNPDGVVFVLRLDKNDKAKLEKLVQ